MAKKKTITVNQLHKMLGKLVENGHGRLPMCVDKSSFQHNCESDGVVILPVDQCEVEYVLQSDDDGGVKENQDGSESQRRTAVLRGDAGHGYKTVLHPTAVEDFIRSIEWSGEQDDLSVTLVAGNIRNHAAHLRRLTGA